MESPPCAIAKTTSGMIPRRSLGARNMVHGVRLFLRLGLAITILSGAMAGALRADTDPVIGFFLGYSRAVNTVALSADGRQAVSAGQDNVLRLWDIPTGL